MSLATCMSPWTTALHSQFLPRDLSLGTEAASSRSFQNPSYQCNLQLPSRCPTHKTIGYRRCFVGFHALSHLSTSDSFMKMRVTASATCPGISEGQHQAPPAPPISFPDFDKTMPAVADRLEAHQWQDSSQADVDFKSLFVRVAATMALTFFLWGGNPILDIRPAFAETTTATVTDVFPLTAVASLPPGKTPILDAANILPDGSERKLAARLSQFADESGWRILVLTRLGPGTPPTADDIRAYWQPDERTVIVIEDSTAPNILNFNVGDSVFSLLPRQFFLELQSRYGNQFFVREEGDTEAVTQSVEALLQCLGRPDGCNNVPGLTDELYFITLGLAIAGGTVFGYAARLPPSGRMDSSWQWVLAFSPLWFILSVPFGVLPIVARTDDIVPLLKNATGFFGGAAAVYLTPILGRPPMGKSSDKRESEEDDLM